MTTEVCTTSHPYPITVWSREAKKHAESEETRPPRARITAPPPETNGPSPPDSPTSPTPLLRAPQDLPPAAFLAQEDENTAYAPCQHSVQKCAHGFLAAIGRLPPQLCGLSLTLAGLARAWQLAIYTITERHVDTVSPPTVKPPHSALRDQLPDLSAQVSQAYWPVEFLYLTSAVTLILITMQAVLKPDIMRVHLSEPASISSLSCFPIALTLISWGSALLRNVTTCR